MVVNNCIDLDIIKLIKNSTLNDLVDHNYLENLIIKLGLNNECLQRQPKIVQKNVGGLFIWQYPNQFSKYLTLLQKQNITSYIEIGCRWGGTFILTNEYLKMFNNVNKSVAVDIIDSPVKEYCLQNKETEFLKMNSRSDDFKNYITNNTFDLIFIDGDHSLLGVTNDYEICRNNGKIFVFHDIVNERCKDVVRFWNSFKINEKNNYDFFEFVEQYNEIPRKFPNQKWLGIGVAIKKSI